MGEFALTLHAPTMHIPCIHVNLGSLPGLVARRMNSSLESCFVARSIFAEWFKTSLSSRQVFGSIPGLVKTNIESPMARHRYNVSS